MHITWILMNWSDPVSSTSHYTPVPGDIEIWESQPLFPAHNSPGTSSPTAWADGPQRACTLTLICHCPWKQTRPSCNTTDFQIPKGGQASPHPHALNHAILSPWNVNPAYLHSILLPVLWNIIVSPPSWIFLWSLSKLQISPLPCSKVFHMYLLHM